MAHFCTVTATFTIQVSRIVAAFSLQPPIYLIKEFENSVLFPSESSGKFNPSSLSSGSLYEVQGTEQVQDNSSLSLFSARPQSTYGTYPYPPPTQPPYQPSNPPPHPPLRSKRKTIKKTILIANLSPRDPNKPSSSRANRLVHTIVTQIIISLEAGECNVTRAAENVRKQIGFDVVLLDCKLFPLIDNDTTSGQEFWRSTRKIIAVSRVSYEKIAGVAPGEELSQVDDDVVITEPPPKKVKETRECNISDCFEIVNKKLDSLCDKFSSFDGVVNAIKKIFECVICQSVVNSPVISHCCQRIIGCSRCVATWRENSTRPLCSVSGRMGDTFQLKGFDDLTNIFRIEEGERELLLWMKENPLMTPLVILKIYLHSIFQGLSKLISSSDIDIAMD